MNFTNHLKGVMAFALVAFAMPHIYAQSVSLSESAPSFGQNFDGMGTGKVMPDCWRIDRNTTGRLGISTWENAQTETQYTGRFDTGSNSDIPESSANLPGNAKNGSYNFASSSNSADRAVGGISTGVAGGARCHNVMTTFTNGDDNLSISSLAIKYNVEKYRDGNNAAGFDVQLYYSLDGVNWTSAGTQFLTHFAADGATAGMDEVPSVTTSVSNNLAINIPAGQQCYLAWHIGVAAGNDCSGAQALAIDDVEVTATFGEPQIEEPADDEAIALSAASPSMSENFDSMHSEGAPTLQLPAGWRIDRRLHSEGTDYWIAPFESASKEVMYSGGVSLAANASNGTYNFGPSTQSSDRAIGGLTTGSGTAGGVSTKCFNLMTSINNADATLSIAGLKIAYDIEKYRKGNNSAGFGVQLYTSTDGVNWTSAGDKFYTFFAPDDQTIGAAEVPIATVAIDPTDLYVHVRPGQTLYLAWQVATGGHVKEANGAQGLAIDNVAITATFAEESESEVTSITITPANVTLVPTLPERVKVLSLNNSLIDYNAQYTIFNEIATAMGKKAVWTNHTNLGQPLSYHYNETGANSARAIVAGDYWSHIILQEHSSLPRTDFATFRESVAKWVAYIRENCPNPNAVIIMPVNWGFNENEFANLTAQNNTLLANYTAVAQEFGITLAPVARAYQMYYDENGVDATKRLYTDNRHPSAAASYMAACMEYQLIFGEDATTITYTSNLGEYADMAADMRSYGSRAFQDFDNPVDHNAGTVMFTAKAIDQWGNEVNTDDIVLTSDAGTFSNGVFTLNTTATGSYTVTATSGSATGQATVTVAQAVEPAPLEEDLVVHGYLNLNFKNVHLVGETAADNRPIGLGAPYTVTLATDGTVVYRIDYSAASIIENAPKPQIWKGNFYNMTNEGGGIYSYTFDGSYSQGDKVSFSRYVNGAADEGTAITLVANEPIVLGEPASMILNVASDFVLGSAPVATSVTVRDAMGHNLNDYPSPVYSGSDGVAFDGIYATLGNLGVSTITATIPETSISASATITRATSDGAVNLALNAPTTADEGVKNATSNAVDGNVSTQTEWTITAKNEEHYLTIDLGSLASVEAVMLVWEGASATVYDVNFSRNGDDVDNTFEVTNGAGGAGMTVYKYLYNDDLTAFNTRYVTINMHTVYDAGWGLKLKEVGVYGHLLDPVEFNLGNINVANIEGSGAHLTGDINHSNHEEVLSYNIWAVDTHFTPSVASPLRAPASGDYDADGYVVGAVSIDNDGSDRLSFTLPLDNLSFDNNVHTLAVRAQALLSDGTTVNSTSWNKGDAEGAAGFENYKVYTSPDGGVTGLENISTDFGAPVYYNLQGMRVARPAEGRVYIVVRQGSVSKIVF